MTAVEVFEQVGVCLVPGVEVAVHQLHCPPHADASVGLQGADLLPANRVADSPREEPEWLVMHDQLEGCEGHELLKRVGDGSVPVLQVSFKKSGAIFSCASAQTEMS